MKKKCSSCKKLLSISAFGINRASKDGLMNRCKACNRAAFRAYYETKNGSKEQREAEQRELLNRIRALRNAGYRLKDIAEKTGLDKSSISYYLNNKRKVGTAAVKRFKERVQRCAS